MLVWPLLLPVMTVLSANLHDVLSNSSALNGTGSTTSPSNLYNPPAKLGINLTHLALSVSSIWLIVEDNIDPGPEKVNSLIQQQ